MGTFISAILSAISSKPTDNPSQSQSQSVNTSNVNSSTLQPSQTTSSSSLAKRKSKPELLVHTPVPINQTDCQIHEFIWKYGAKDSVHLAGTFTNWIPSIPMVPVDHNREYWRALVQLDPKQEWQFKFVVDGIWRCGLDLPTITDPQGNTNNIIRPE